jgi:hypothetical protein
MAGIIRTQDSVGDMLSLTNEYLPVIISSVNPRIIRQRPIIAATLSEEEKHHIVRTLESQSTIRGVSTELAIQAGQNQVAAEVPKVYERFAKLFSRSIISIPTIKTMGSRNRFQTNCSRRTPL